MKKFYDSFCRFLGLIHQKNLNLIKNTETSETKDMNPFSCFERGRQVESSFFPFK